MTEVGLIVGMRWRGRAESALLFGAVLPSTARRPTCSFGVSQTGSRRSGRSPPCQFTSVDDVTRTTLTRGQSAPLLHRSSAAPLSTLPQRSLRVFLRRDVRHRADYFANPESASVLPPRTRTPPCAARLTDVTQTVEGLSGIGKARSRSGNTRAARYATTRSLTPRLCSTLITVS